MTAALPLVLGFLFAAPPEEKATPLRYVRPVGDKYVTESEITVTPDKRGSTYTSTTSRTSEDGEIKMTLTLRLDATNAITTAEALLTTPKSKKKATLALFKDHARLKREGTTELLNHVPAAPVVTTAPDWSDVIQLVTRFDAKKGGKQEFGGVWFHPVDQWQILSFTIERAGEDKITLKEREITLHRYDIQLRSGGYRAWSDAEGRVVRIVPRGQGSVPIVLEGYEEATRELK